MKDERPEEMQSDQTVVERYMLLLTAEESVWFTDLLLQPPREPGEALLRAAGRHRELFGIDPT